MFIICFQGFVLWNSKRWQKIVFWCTAYRWLIQGATLVAVDWWQFSHDGNVSYSATYVYGGMGVRKCCCRSGFPIVYLYSQQSPLSSPEIFCARFPMMRPHLKVGEHPCSLTRLIFLSRYRVHPTRIWSGMQSTENLETNHRNSSRPDYFNGRKCRGYAKVAIWIAWFRYYKSRGLNVARKSNFKSRGYLMWRMSRSIFQFFLISCRFWQIIREKSKVAKIFSIKTEKVASRKSRGYQMSRENAHSKVAGI